MAENLKVTHYRNGDDIPNVTDNSTWANLTTGACCNYDNNEGNVSTYGRLYNWAAAMNIDQSYNTTSYTTTYPHQGMCPDGWHLPSAGELADELGIQEQGARKRISRIERDPHYNYIRAEGKIKLLDEEALVTERLTARVLRLLVEQCAERPEGLVRKDEFADYAAKTLADLHGDLVSREVLLSLIAQNITRDYIRTVFLRPECIRPGPRIVYEEQYLKEIGPLPNP